MAEIKETLANCALRLVWWVSRRYQNVAILAPREEIVEWEIRIVDVVDE